MTTRIRLSIVSNDSFDTEMREEVEAVKEVHQDKKTYIYRSEIGDCNLDVYEDKVVMNRVGESHAEMELSNSGKGTLAIHTPELHMSFDITDGELFISEKEIRVHYSIYDNGHFVNSLKVVFKELE